MGLLIYIIILVCLSLLFLIGVFTSTYKPAIKSQTADDFNKTGQAGLKEYKYTYKNIKDR